VKSTDSYWSKLGLQAKIFLVSLLLVVGLTSALLLFSYRRASQLAQESLRVALTSTRELYENLEADRLEKLQLINSVIVESPYFKAAVVEMDAATTLDPAAESLDQGQRFPLCAPGPLEELFEAARLERIEVMAIDIETRFRDFDDFWLPFLGGQGSAPTYVAGLDAGRQSALREHLRETLPATSDGSISMTARAWAVRGRR